MTITVIIKPTATGDKITLPDVDENTLVVDLKTAIAQHSPIAAEDQRVIYRGQILKNDRTIASYGIAHEHVLHLVKGKSSEPPAASPAPPAAASQGAGSMNPMGMFGDPSAMGDMMNSPMIQGMMNDPEIMRSLLGSNPAVREMMDRNPEIGQMLNNPGHLRQMMENMRNPSLMAEQMRQTDRQLSNIEAMPEGFNRLRQMYETVQEPMLNAAMSGDQGDGAGAAASNPLMAALMGAMGGGAGAQQQAGTTTSGSDPNANPLPNPWTAGAGGGGGRGAGGAPAGLGGMGLGGMPGFGGMPGMGAGMPPPAEMAQVLQNPAMQTVMRSLASNPALMQTMMDSNPMMRNNPAMREQMTSIMRDPTMMQRLLDPANLQAMMQMQGAMRHLESSGMSGMLGGMGGGAGGMGGGAGMPADLMGLLSQGMGGAGAGAPVPTPVPVADPETAYASQLQQLQDMGFYDRPSNIVALQATAGNVNAAVDRLLSQ